VLFAGVVAMLAIFSNADAVTITLGVFATAFVMRLVYECSSALGTIQRALRRPGANPFATPDAIQAQSQVWIELPQEG
jgi:hypothetical protein